MVASREAVKQHVLDVIDSLPDEALGEVVSFLEAQQLKIDTQSSRTTPYEPVQLGGLWRGIQISDEDIAEVRREMWARFADTES